MTEPRTNSGSTWSVVLPYFNEANFLELTLRSLAAQDVGSFRLILVDNASTDNSASLAHAVMAAHPGIDTLHIAEARPGKIHALAAGLARVESEFVAFCDADTFYPPHYLKRCAELFAHGGETLAAVMAMDLPTEVRGAAARWAAWRKRAKVMAVAHLWPRQTHTGGFGQNFRTAALRKAGGFSAERWPYVLEDHEIMQRVFKVGAARYAADLWCVPSARRTDRVSVGWTRAEQLLYHATPFILKDWYFYSFLQRRLSARGLASAKLREKSW